MPPPEPIRRWRPRRVDYRDLLTLAGLPFQLAIADWLPCRAWPPLGGIAGSFRATRQPAWHRREAAHIAHYLGCEPGDPVALEAHRELLAWLRISQWMTLAARRRDGWRPATRLHGGEHLQAALAAGRGVILWVAPFVLANLAVKVALDAAGHRLVHLSRSTHGPARSIHGARLANSAFVAGELRFLDERVVIGDDGSPTAALRRLARRLAENRAVSITALAVGDRPLEVPFLNGRMRLAPGAPRLSCRTGAPILPALAIARPDASIDVELGLPQPSPGGDSAEAVKELARLYAAAIADRALAHPGQLVWRLGLTPG